jgi:hypothetical protein
MDEQLQKRIDFLRATNAQVMPHTERGLLDHLLGTRELLSEWRGRPALCDAGLFHSVYGTEHYGPQAIPLSMRAAVRELIGQEAEWLAWLFCIMRRETFDENLPRTEGFTLQDRLTQEWIPLTAGQFSDLVAMTFANTLEAFPRLPWSLRRTCRAYLRPFRKLAMPGAQNAFDQNEARWWQFWK